MSIAYHESTKTFHLTNGQISYIMKVLPNGALGQLYFGKAIRDRESFDHLLEMKHRPMSSWVFEGNKLFSLEHTRQEYPSYGSTDYRHPAVQILQPDGSRITDFVVQSHSVTPGKPALEGLPATYCESGSEAETLTVHLRDELLGVSLDLNYTLFADRPALARSARLVNEGDLDLHLTHAMSLCLDLPDRDYEFVHFSGAWSRERWMKVRRLEQGNISYVKWDMNRSISEPFSEALPPDRQGELFHRYILGVYRLYERLTASFPHVLFESCSSGGGRFDPGMLYYAPQCWASDDSDAVERLKIQYGTSYCYPISSIGAHVSAVPNHQVKRITPLATRANVAHFGTFGYELDLNKLTAEEREQVRQQIAFMKEYREVLQFGDFYRLRSPFDGNFTSWMAVSGDKKTALVGWYRTLSETNGSCRRVKLQGLDPELCYQVDGGGTHYGDELMNLGLVTTDSGAGECQPGERPICDFDSHIFVLKA